MVVLYQACFTIPLPSILISSPHVPFKGLSKNISGSLSWFVRIVQDQKWNLSLLDFEFFNSSSDFRQIYKFGHRGSHGFL